MYGLRGGAASALAICTLALASCGGTDEGTAAGESGLAADAKSAPALDAAKTAKGSVTYCTGKDFSGDHKDVIAGFNRRYASQGLKAKLLEFPEEADEQRNQFVQRQEAKSGECDVFYSDVVWTAEFAAQGWLLNMSDYVAARKNEFIASTLSTAEFAGRYFGVPKQADAGLLYYRTDQTKEAPRTWQDLYSEAGRKEGLVYQGSAYEGLTVDFLEVAAAAGGKVLSEDGKKSEFNSPENVKALELMVEGIKSGAAPKAVTTYTEEPARRAFEAGRATFMRNWPYAYALGQKAPKVKGKFDVAPLPEFEGGSAAGILGGHNYVISAFSKNPEGAMLLVDYATSPEVVSRHAVEFSIGPPLIETYEEPALRKSFPFAADFKQAVEQAQSRPVSPVYPQISQAIYENVNAALAGDTSPRDAIAKADEQITKALQTF